MLNCFSFTTEPTTIVVNKCKLMKPIFRRESIVTRHPKDESGFRPCNIIEKNLFLMYIRFGFLQFMVHFLCFEFHLLKHPIPNLRLGINVSTFQDTSQDPRAIRLHENRHYIIMFDTIAIDPFDPKAIRFRTQVPEDFKTINSPPVVQGNDV